VFHNRPKVPEGPKYHTLQLPSEGNRIYRFENREQGRTKADEVIIVPRSQQDTIRAWLAHRLEMDNHGDGDPLFVSLSNRSWGQRLATRSIRVMVKACYKVAGVVGNAKTTHSLRHSAIANASRRGASPMQVQAMARHASFDTTLGYSHETARLDNPAEDLIH
jgi:integrase/recombinase XerD